MFLVIHNSDILVREFPSNVFHEQFVFGLDTLHTHMYTHTHTLYMHRLCAQTNLGNTKLNNIKHVSQCRCLKHFYYDDVHCESLKRNYINYVFTNLLDRGNIFSSFHLAFFLFPNCKTYSTSFLWNIFSKQ